MKCLTFALALLCTALCTAIAPSAQADELLDAVKSNAASISGGDWPVTVEMRSTENDKPESIVTLRYDPSTEDGAAWSLVSVEGVEDEAKLRKDLESPDRQQEPPLSYSEVIRVLDWNWEKKSETPSTTVYLSTKLPKGTAKAMGSDISKRLQAEITIDTSTDTPYVSMYRLFAPKPFRLKLVAKAKSFETKRLFGWHQAGKVVATGGTMRIIASALGKDYDISASRRFFDYTPK